MTLGVELVVPLAEVALGPTVEPVALGPSVAPVDELRGAQIVLRRAITAHADALTAIRATPEVVRFWTRQRRPGGGGRRGPR